MTQLRIKELLGKANFLLDKGLHIMPGFVIIRNAEMEATLDRIDASIPEDIKEAEIILKRRDEIHLEAQNRAERIINDAQNEAARILSESELLRAVQQEASKIREQVISDCEDIKDQAIKESENTKMLAMQEAVKIREGAENYAEQILNNLDTDLNQLQQIVRNGQMYLEKQKADSYQSMPNMYQQEEEYILE